MRAMWIEKDQSTRSPALIVLLSNSWNSAMALFHSVTSAKRGEVPALMAYRNAPKREAASLAVLIMVWVEMKVNYLQPIVILHTPRVRVCEDTIQRLLDVKFLRKYLRNFFRPTSIVSILYGLSSISRSMLPSTSHLRHKWCLPRWSRQYLQLHPAWTRRASPTQNHKTEDLIPNHKYSSRRHWGHYNTASRKLSKPRWMHSNLQFLAVRSW